MSHKTVAFMNWGTYKNIFQTLWNACNWTRTQNHLVLKRTFNHLAKLTKWFSCVLSTYLYGVRVQYLSVRCSGFESSCSDFTFRFRACFEQGVPWHSGNYRVWIHSENAYVTWQEHTVLWNAFWYFPSGVCNRCRNDIVFFKL